MVSESQRKAIAKWNKDNLKQINLALKIPEYNQVKEYCAALEIPVNTFIRSVIQAAINNENITIIDCIGSDNYNRLAEILQARNIDLKAFFKDLVQKYIDKEHN